MIYKVFSDERLSGSDLTKLKYLLKNGKDIRLHLGNIFPDRFERMIDERIFFGKGRRRYTELIIGG